MPEQRDPALAQLQEGQRTFAEALLRHAPSGNRRFSVYRNNVHASLIATLVAHFPVVRRLVGEQFFEATAVAFLRKHPPQTPVLSEYGFAFAEFLQSFAPAAALSYLPDVARLEWALNVAHNALDETSLGLDALAALPPESAAGKHVTLHPAAFVISSPWPVVSIWTTNTRDDEVRHLDLRGGGEAALVTRPGLDVSVALLPTGADLFIAALARGEALGDAVASTESVEGFDLAATLAVLFNAGAIAALVDGKPE